MSSIVTTSEWLDWKSNFVTKEFFIAARERVKDAKDILGMSAGIDPISDNFYRGFIAAYEEMQEFKVGETVDDN